MRVLFQTKTATRAAVLAAVFILGFITHRYMTTCGDMPAKSYEQAQACNGEAIKYSMLPPGRYHVDAVIDERLGLVVASNDFALPPVAPPRRLVSDVPPDATKKGHELEVVESPGDIPAQ
jgi:hypothetical protein